MSTLVYVLAYSKYCKVVTNTYFSTIWREAEILYIAQVKLHRIKQNCTVHLNENGTELTVIIIMLVKEYTLVVFGSNSKRTACVKRLISLLLNSFYKTLQFLWLLSQAHSHAPFKHLDENLALLIKYSDLQYVMQKKLKCKSWYIQFIHTRDGSKC